MKDKLKKKTKIGKKMRQSAVKKNNQLKKSSDNSNLKIISLFDRKEELCHNLDTNLFQLEKDMAYFRFAVKELEEIIKIL
ncbi:MAG: hypothetical protein OXC37_02280 [Bdellovibrionaceae bacterium]|nr:hypothetical protein [Pseudobdellovibrionaceae bacterium]